ncbi:MAG: tRNA lysidine(34) synthetase TilS [Magnetococcales bacterium]|nr:tRNA lysidine(34) synthetase TilS [Magnetococcales bacterium]
MPHSPDGIPGGGYTGSGALPGSLPSARAVSIDPVLSHLRKAITPLLTPGTALVVAVSGGPDSMALMHLLVRSGLTNQHPTVVAHFDHALRIDSATDADFVIQQARQLHLTTHVERWQHPPTTGNLLEQARQARYHFLLRIARHTDATAILTGHQQDDQAETFLERLLRGSGVRGLGAMAPVRPLEPFADTPIQLVRPLLALRRDRLRHWLQTHHLPWREDPGNLDQRRLRSRLRQQTLPSLATLTPDGDPVSRLAQTAERLRDADKALAWSWQRVRPELDLLSLEPGTLSLSFPHLITLPDEIIRRALVHCHTTITGDPFPPGARAMAGFLHHLHLNRPTWSMRMRGMTVLRQQERLIFVAT